MDRFIQRRKAPAGDDGNSVRTPLGSGSGNSTKRRQETTLLRDPPPKKTRVEEVKDSGGDDDDVLSQDSSSINTPSGDPDDDDNSDDEDLSAVRKPAADHQQTAFEISLPAVVTDKAAIQQYEAMRASQSSQDATDSASTRLENRQWVRGRNSIYVDAFNLALDTVLENESRLFDTKEKHVFDEWKNLSYEAQYLYVRLFLRKTASWHRIERLNHYTDISNMQNAIADLQACRTLPEDQNDEDEKEELSLGLSFTFADKSESSVTTLEEAATLINLDELKMFAKEAKVDVQGKTKPDIIKAFCRNSARQSSLFSLGLRRSDSDGSTDPKDSNRNSHFLAKIFATTGPLIRVSEPIFKLFERVHLVFYRSTEWTEKSLTTIILARVTRRNFPEYIVCRSSNIFASRRHLVEFELSMRRQFEVDQILEFNKPPGERGLLKIVELFEDIAPRWRELLKEEQHREDHVYEFGEGGYLRRFNAAHAYARIAHKAAHVLGRLHRYREEHALLTELLTQRLFHPSRRGSWYQRKALLEERYMWQDDPDPVSTHSDIQKKHWLQMALITCETALEDRDCHLIYHYDLQKRLLKLEKRLSIPFRSRHYFGHVKLLEPEEHTVGGIQLVRDDPRTRNKAGRPTAKTTWLDELGGPDENGKPPHVGVEGMCLSHYRSQGWKGYHSEGGILRTLFAYLFFDVLFVYIPNVFQTAYQTCPLDLHTDAFYPARASQINHRLVEIANGKAERILRDVHERESDKRTCVVGLNWDFDIDDLAELVDSFDGGALAAVCKVMAEDYRARGGGVPDLVLWRTGKTESQTNEEGHQQQKGEVMFAEVKSANDRLSDTQRLWIHVLTGAGVRVALCNAVAKEVRPLN
ncbi:VRR-NUC domain-containing protein [Cladorrhinum sp. PSN332]|nr:VRR-NUC domain-containing protein [Cladorrhinum sp. PSN332]